jgi:hypothetical protein
MGRDTEPGGKHCVMKARPLLYRKMSLAIVVDGHSLLGGMRFSGGERILSSALRGLRTYFGCPTIAIFFGESRLLADRKSLKRRAISQGFQVRAIDHAIESAIITELVELSHDHDHVVLASGDAAFTEAVQALVGRGTRVSVVAAQRGLSPALSFVATSVTDLAKVISVAESPAGVQVHRAALGPDDAAFVRALRADQIAPLRAVSAGIRLEEFLRNLCLRQTLQIPTSAGISQMNDALLKQGAYGKVLHRKVALWGAIRNEAAHGAERGFSSKDLRQMEIDIDELLREAR